eukprot:TRINITY_DN22607_c0_g1_i1.p1 TRINITY_DN22607_c0_g1~~TRINITY_DN22607_c0_g1_i1.p1  ORF type:complete len:258 (+),score=34.53 TRINITY_DN22607_c0_g1_i1:61-774(+)
MCCRQLPPLKVLMILTSHDKLGDTGKPTGFWLEEFASPYYLFKSSGDSIITIASPAGGQPPLDPKSEDESSQTEATRRFVADADAKKALASTVKLSEVSADDFDVIFYPGGHGPLWDLAEDPASIALLQKAISSGKVVGLVCHAPGVLKNVKNPDGEPVVKGRKVTGFSNTEEEAVELTKVVPFLVETMLTEAGGSYSKAAADWTEHVVADGRLITGQNPGSSAGTAAACLAAAGRK